MELNANLFPSAWSGCGAARLDIGYRLFQCRNTLFKCQLCHDHLTSLNYTFANSSSTSRWTTSFGAPF
jgi:hypothetical protein